MQNSMLQVIKQLFIAIWRRWKLKLQAQVTVLEHIPDYEQEGEGNTCTNCETLKLWLDREIEEKENLQQIIFVNARLIHPSSDEVTDKKDYKPIHRSVPLRVRRAQREHEQRQQAKQNKGQTVKPANENEKSPGEILFEEKLKETEVH